MSNLTYICSMPCKNKLAQKEHAAKHYQANKEAMIEKAMRQNSIARQRNKEYITDYLGTHPCVDCGNSDIRVLEFDHVRGEKKGDISNMKLRAYSLKTIQEEVAKCEVRCANCHRIITYERRKSKSGPDTI